jgi:hypothetical protein
MLRRGIAMLAGPVVVLALATAGCGGDDGGDDSSGAAEDAAQGYVDALTSGDYAEACTYFEDEELEERMGGAKKCEKSMAATTKPDALAGFEVTGTREGEEGATIVEFTTDDAPPNEFALIEEDDGEWVFFED